MAKKIEDILGAKEEENKPGQKPAGLDPLTATPDGTDGEQNPLQQMDEVTGARPDKKENKSKALDEDIVTDMFKTGENTDGMFTPKDKEEHQEEDKGAKVKVGTDVKPSEKYEKEFKTDMLEHPDDYKVKTPRGEMTITEARKAGYNPITKRFEKGHGAEAIKEKYLAGLNDADRAALEQFTSPTNAQVAPADAEKYGLQPGSPMIRPEQQGNPTAGMNPMAALMGGSGSPATGPAAGPTPIGGAMPGSEESMAPGGIDISALLGGGR